MTIAGKSRRQHLHPHQMPGTQQVLNVYMNPQVLSRFTPQLHAQTTRRMVEAQYRNDALATPHPCRLTSPPGVCRRAVAAGRSGFRAAGSRSTAPASPGSSISIKPSCAARRARINCSVRGDRRGITIARLVENSNFAESVVTAHSNQPLGVSIKLRCADGNPAQSCFASIQRGT